MSQTRLSNNSYTYIHIYIYIYNMHLIYLMWRADSLEKTPMLGSWDWVAEQEKAQTLLSIFHICGRKSSVTPQMPTCWPSTPGHTDFRPSFFWKLDYPEKLAFQDISNRTECLLFKAKAGHFMRRRPAVRSAVRTLFAERSRLLPLGLSLPQAAHFLRIWTRKNPLICED